MQTKTSHSLGVIYNAQGCMRKSFACGANIYTKGVSVDFSCGAVTFEHASTHEECGWNHVVVAIHGRLLEMFWSTKIGPLC